ncbi:phosphatase PAP2 family protein [Francisella sp. SYW-9]|uniref:phosphatase PAP2 family protein n=1 Tax=Francisella sp. SYW-9 TaxID=2610888 RepID=UPI00123DA59D|nr:phosphatase PAP2 family protein [Francisella sp. SYW-9]
MSNIRNLALFFIIGIALIVFFYFFVDRQIVWFLHDHHSRSYKILEILANDIVFYLRELIPIFYIYFFIKLVIKKTNNLDYKVLLIANAVVIGQILKDFLKGIFGRYWTATFINNNPSLIRDHVYGFNWFHSGSAYGSFPSGHATFILSFSVTAWILFPKLRWLWALLAALVVASQLLMYFHFASDLIAGSMLGTLVGYYTASFYNKRSST